MSSYYYICVGILLSGGEPRCRRTASRHDGHGHLCGTGCAQGRTNAALFKRHKDNNLKSSGREWRVVCGRPPISTALVPSELHRLGRQQCREQRVCQSVLENNKRSSSSSTCDTIPARFLLLSLLALLVQKYKIVTAEDVRGRRPSACETAHHAAGRMGGG